MEENRVTERGLDVGEQGDREHLEEELDLQVFGHGLASENQRAWVQRGSFEGSKEI